MVDQIGGNRAAQEVPDRSTALGSRCFLELVEDCQNRVSSRHAQAAGARRLDQLCESFQTMQIGTR